MLTMLLDYGIVYIMSVIALLVAGFLLYWLIRHPIKSLEFILKSGFLLMLGLLVYFGVLYYLTI